MLDTVGIQQVTDKAKRAWEAAQAIKRDNFDAEKRQWSDPQYKASYETALEDALKIKDEADAELKIFEREKTMDQWLSETAGGLPGMSGKTKSSTGEEAAQNLVRYKSSPQSKTIETREVVGRKRAWKASEEIAYNEVFRKYMFDPEEWDNATPEERRMPGKKALSVGLDSAGGALVASELFIATLIEALEDAVIMRQLANVLPPLTSATSLAVPTAGNLDDAAWTAEIQAITMDTAAPFGGRRLTPHQLAKGILLSEPLIRLSTIDAEAWARQEMVTRFSAAEESAFMVGTGNQQPEGLFVSALTTTVTAASATDIDYPDLMAMVTALKRQYRAGASWIMHRTIIGEINLLVDGIGRPLLREMPNAGISFQLLGYPLNESEYAPGTSTAGLKVAALGNYKRAYWIVDSLAMTFKRLAELYSETNQIGYHARKETDGMVVDGNGVNILVMAP